MLSSCHRGDARASDQQMSRFKRFQPHTTIMRFILEAKLKGSEENMASVEFSRRYKIANMTVRM